ncbi:MAG: hypothetical protein KDK70_19680 [Myxococcales bacterium]|nr:hypothetical protein [Myxococcales bacterium]
MLVLLPVVGGAAWLALRGAGEEPAGALEVAQSSPIVVAARTGAGAPLESTEHSDEGPAAASEGSGATPEVDDGAGSGSSEPAEADAESKTGPRTTKARPKGPDKAECEAKRAKAKTAKTSRSWTGVLAATSNRACWAGSELKLERRRLRVEAHAELGNFAKCVREGGSSPDGQTAVRVKWCQKKLGG